MAKDQSEDSTKNPISALFKAVGGVGAILAGAFFLYCILFIPNPDIPTIPYPKDGAANISPNTNLSWIGGTSEAPLVGQLPPVVQIYKPIVNLTYKIYLSINKSNIEKVNIQPFDIISGGKKQERIPAYKPLSPLTPNSKYYWKVIAYDSDNHEKNATSQIWNFTTIDSPRIVDFNFTPQNVNAGAPLIFNWSVINADEVQFIYDNDKIHENVGFKGSKIIEKAKAGEYKLIAKNIVGETRASKTVNVNLPIPIINFNSTRNQIESGDPITLSWHVQNATEVMLYFDGINGTSYPNDHIMTVRPSKSINYTIRAINKWEDETKEERKDVSIKVKPKVRFFKVYPPEVIKGSSTTLEWEVFDADTINITTIENGHTKETEAFMDQKGSELKQIDANTKFILTASNDVNVTSVGINVNVISCPLPHIISIIPNYPKIDQKVEFKGYADLCPDSNGKMTYLWSSDKETLLPPSSMPNMTYEFSVSGKQAITFKVIDSNGRWNETTPQYIYVQ